MNGQKVRMRIDYRSETSGKFFQSQVLAASSLELLDRVLRLRAKEVTYIHIYVKLKGPRGRWRMVATSDGGSKVWPWNLPIDARKFSDREYMEGVVVSAFELAVNERKKDDLSLTSYRRVT